MTAESTGRPYLVAQIRENEDHVDGDLTTRGDGCLNVGCGLAAIFDLLMLGWIVVLLIQRI
ncbi:hypothetical protein ABZ490_22230 [Streptomyces sp. NPDC005811]|uniref:hypothetical protein n=1 Tax=Streptomyces sp. NPDC005811 TaxID=3154565 RepID=UPI0033CA7E0B